MADKAKKETKRQKFERIAERRVNEAVKTLKLIGNLADRGNYEYTDAHVQQLFGALEQELRTMKAKFRAESTSKRTKSFQFGSVDSGRSQ